jgi:hypothetical protein
MRLDDYREITPIPTFYKGCFFRSRLEARWAVYFDEIGLPWKYEPVCFQLTDTDFYIPDFKIPEFGFAEVKPSAFTDLELSKVILLNRGLIGLQDTIDGYDIMLLDGVPEYGKSYDIIRGFSGDMIGAFNEHVYKWGSTPDVADGCSCEATEKALSFKFSAEAPSWNREKPKICDLREAIKKYGVLEIEWKKQIDEQTKRDIASLEECIVSLECTVSLEDVMNNKV